MTTMRAVSKLKKLRADTKVKAKAAAEANAKSISGTNKARRRFQRRGGILGSSPVSQSSTTPRFADIALQASPRKRRTPEPRGAGFHDETKGEEQSPATSASEGDRDNPDDAPPSDSVRSVVYLARGISLDPTSTLASLQRRVESLMDRKVGRLFVPPPTIIDREAAKRDPRFQVTPLVDDGDSSSDDGAKPPPRSAPTGDRDAATNTKVLLFVDDVGRASNDCWGHCPSAELLRQLMEREGYHSAGARGAPWTQVRGVQVRRPKPSLPGYNRVTARVFLLLQVIAALRTGLAHKDYGTHSGFDTSHGDPRALQVPLQLNQAYAPSSTGTIPARTLAKFRVVNMSEPDDTEVVAVLQQQLLSHFHSGNEFAEDVQIVARSMIPVRCVACIGVPLARRHRNVTRF